MTIEYDKLLLCALLLLNEKTGRRSITEKEFKNFCGILRLKEDLKIKYTSSDNGELLMTYFDMVSLLDIGPSAYRLKLIISLEEINEKLLVIMDKDLIERIKRATISKWYILTLEEENAISKFRQLDLKYKIEEMQKTVNKVPVLDSQKLIRVKTIKKGF